MRVELLQWLTRCVSWFHVKVAFLIAKGGMKVIVGYARVSTNGEDLDSDSKAGIIFPPL